MTKKGDFPGKYWKKFFNFFFENFSNFLKKSQGSPYEIFWLKVTLDIKMSNPWLYLNHQYMVKYCVFMPFLAVQKSPFRVRTPCTMYILHMCVAKCRIYRTFPKCPYNRLEALKWRWYFDNIVFKMHKQRNSMKYNTTIVIVSFTPRHTAERVTFTQTYGYGMTLNFLQLFLKSAWITLRTRLRKVDTCTVCTYIRR